MDTLERMVQALLEGAKPLPPEDAPQLLTDEELDAAGGGGRGYQF